MVVVEVDAERFGMGQDRLGFSGTLGNKRKTRVDAQMPNGLESIRNGYGFR